MANWKNVQYKNGQYRTSEGGGGSSTLSGLDDVTISSASNGQVLKYNSTSSKWVNDDPPTAGVVDVQYDDVSVVDSNGIAHLEIPYLDDIADVEAENPNDGDVLTYSSDTNEWIPSAPTGGGISDVTLDGTSVVSNHVAILITPNVSSLTDTNISSPTNGQVLKYDSSSSKWINAAESGGGGSSTLAGLSDVDTTGVADTNVLAYSSSQSKWVPASAGGGSGTLAGLSDVDTVGATNGQVLKFDTYSNKWVNGNESIGVTTLAGLTDVDTTGVSDGNALIYDNTTSKWVPGEKDAVSDVQVNGTSVVNSKVAQIVSYKELTRAEYDLLPDTKLTDGVMYCIKDGFSNPNGFPPLIYSTEEREVGVWIDGKPLYEKTFESTSGLIDTSVTWDLSGLNIDKVISQKGNWCRKVTSSGDLVWYATDNLANPDFTYQCRIACGTTGYNTLYNTISMPSGNEVIYRYVTLQYTKTTDIAGSGKWTTQGTPTHHYSTTEHIIGTWIDGKTLYEKTYELTSDLSVIQDDWIDTPISKGDIDKIISSEILHSGSTQWGCISARVTSNSNYVQLFNSRATSLSVRYITIRYTKTTD